MGKMLVKQRRRWKQQDLVANVCVLGGEAGRGGEDMGSQCFMGTYNCVADECLDWGGTEYILPHFLF